MVNKSGKCYWWHILLVAATVLAAIPKVFIGMDYDESYIITMGIRLLNGDRLFDTMWELHMTSAWPAYLGLAFYQMVTGTLEGSAIFLRVLSVLFQFFTGWMAYCVIKKYHSRHTAVLTGIFVANFLPRATQNLEYGLLQMLFVTIAVLLLYDEVMCRESILRVIGAGIFYALGVLAYPTIILSFPVLLVGLYFCSGKQAHRENKWNRWRLPVLFAMACGICALVFLAYVLSYIPFSEFMANLRGILMDGTHADTVKTHTYWSQMVELVKRTILIAAVAGGCCFFFLKILPAEDQNSGFVRIFVKKKSLFWYSMLLAGSLIFVGLNITGLRPSGPLGLQVRYIIAAAVGIGFVIKMRSRVMGVMFLAPGIAIYVGAMIGSNMGFEENASFLYLAVLAAVILMSEYAFERGGQFRNIGIFCVACFALGLIFCKGYLVRIVGTFPANIAEERVCIEDGVLRGIYVYPEDAVNDVVKKQEMQEYSGKQDVVLYLGNDAICNTFTEGSFTSATCISTPVYNEQWVMYYQNEEHPQPTVIFVDKDNIETLEKFTATEYGAWILERYEFTEEDFLEGEAFFILRLE